MGVFAIKPSGVAYDDLTPEKMVIVDFEGKTVAGNLRPSSDMPMQFYISTGKNWALYILILLMQQHGHNHKDIPIFGTTHADYNTVDIPCAPPMDDEMIKRKL